MIEVEIFGQLTHYWIVRFGTTLYLLTDDDILFSSGKAYTYPYKLRQEYY